MSASFHSSEGHSSEGHASACPQSGAEDVQKRVPPDHGVQKHVPPDQSVQKHVLPEREHPIHLAPLEAHNRPIIIFVTTCTAKRRQILASASAHDTIVTAWSCPITFTFSVLRMVWTRRHWSAGCAFGNLSSRAAWANRATRSRNVITGTDSFDRAKATVTNGNMFGAIPFVMDTSRPRTTGHIRESLTFCDGERSHRAGQDVQKHVPPKCGSGATRS